MKKRLPLIIVLVLGLLLVVWLYPMRHQIMDGLITMCFNFLRDWGYWGVGVLMALESSIVPVPSEAVIPPAAFWTTQPGATMHLWGIVLAGTIGSWVGSALSYLAAAWLGRPFLDKWGKYFLMPPEKIARAEAWMRRYQAGGVFLARLIPVIRHLISLPAGLVRMPFLKFSAVTIAGAGLWCTILAWFSRSIFIKHPEILDANNEIIPAKMMEVFKHQSHVIGIGVLVLLVLYVVMKKLTNEKQPKS